MNIVPWSEVCIDLIGPWTIVADGQILEFDPVTNIAELIRIKNKTSKHVSEQFENSWHSRYARPNRYIHDNRGEFLGDDFQELLGRMGVQSVASHEL